MFRFIQLLVPPSLGVLRGLMFLLFVLGSFGGVTAIAQHSASSLAAGSPESSAEATPASSGAGDDRYRIGPEDVIEVRVFKRPELSRESVRVDARGNIRMPLIDQDIPVACRTEGEVAQEIATRYKKYLLSPQIDVFIREFHSQPAAVIGAVMSPGRFQLQRRVRLLELLAFAGGPAERAGTIQLVHGPVHALCEAASGKSPELISVPITFQLRDTLRGDERANPYILPGDIVALPESEQIYVVGNVIRPGPIALKEPITLSRAIAMAGGTMRDSKRDRVRIIRQVKGSATEVESFVDLGAIEKHRAQDPPMLPNDIIDVPTSAGKTLLHSFAGMVAPAIAQLPVRVAP